MTKGEAEQIAKCVSDMQDAYGVSVSPKTQATMNLCAALGGAYIPRIALYNMRKASENRAPQNKPAAAKQQPQQQPQPQPQPQPQAQTKARAGATVVDIRNAGDAQTPAQLFGEIGFTGEEKGSAF